MSAHRIGHGNYDLRPATRLTGDHELWAGDEALRVLGEGVQRGVIAIDTYPGTDVAALREGLGRVFPEAVIVDVEQAAKPEEQLADELAVFITDDRILGRMSRLPLSTYYRTDALDEIAASVDAEKLTFLVGWGADLVNVPKQRLVLGDMARWEIQTRHRAGAPNWGFSNHDEDPLTKVKRGYFVEWRTADLHKRSLWHRADFWLDGNQADRPKVMRAEAVWAGMAQTVTGPFRVKPYFDPGSWGGQWMREAFGLDTEPANFAWSFDCVPEENSLLLRVGEEDFEIPSINLVFEHPNELLGAKVRSRFGEEFPIRFDLLDTMGGGNLSLQVHPLTGYIRDTFGMAYTQDESYYLLDADPGAEVYLGTRPEIDPVQMMADLRRAQAGEISFPTTDYVNTFPARKHDHFPIPAGTVHCSGANSMVLEISATPFLFTFKMWDWDRLGLDGKPRPINIDHAERNIQWDRTTEWVEKNLIDQAEEIDSGDGWREERTGLHELEFIETRRHWITGTSHHDTQGTVHVKNLVEGAEAIIESPTGAFEPFVVHYAETFIVPAAVGEYTVRPHGASVGQEIATITAWVRGSQME